MNVSFLKRKRRGQSAVHGRTIRQLIAYQPTFVHTKEIGTDENQLKEKGAIYMSKIIRKRVSALLVKCTYGGKFCYSYFRQLFC